jgi:hypothetical protein
VGVAVFPLFRLLGRFLILLPLVPPLTFPTHHIIKEVTPTEITMRSFNPLMATILAIFIFEGTRHRESSTWIVSYFILQNVTSMENILTRMKYNVRK